MIEYEEEGEEDERKVAAIPTCLLRDWITSRLHLWGEFGSVSHGSTRASGCRCSIWLTFDRRL